MTTLNNILKFIELMKISERDFEREVGISRSTLSGNKKRNVELSSENIEKIVKRYSTELGRLGFDIVDLRKFGGKGFSIIQKTIDTHGIPDENQEIDTSGITMQESKIDFLESRRNLKNGDSWLGIPIYNTPISASFVELYRDESYIRPEFYLKDRKYIDCDFGAIIRGDSMHAEIRHGDYVICKEITDIGFIDFGVIYYVVSTNGLETCKYLHPHESDENRFVLVAYNKAIPPSPLPKNYIKRLYKVRGIIRAY